MRQEREESAVTPWAMRMAHLLGHDSAWLAAIPTPTADRLIRPSRHAIYEGDAIAAPLVIVRGWAARVRYFPDGRRQILHVLLPGDMIGVCRHFPSVAATSVVALTELALAPAPRLDRLERAYAESAALEEAYLYRHIARLGRLNAVERVADFLLELKERLTLGGLASGNRFPLPLTQEVMADCLGLTSVHINRMLQQLRHDNLLERDHGIAIVLDQTALQRLSDWKPVGRSN